MSWTLRVRSSSGQATLCLASGPATTLEELQAAIQAATGCPAESELLAGFPPRPVQVACLWVLAGASSVCWALWHMTQSLPHRLAWHQHACLARVQADAAHATPISSLGIANGDSLTVREAAPAPAPAAAAALRSGAAAVTHSASAPASAHAAVRARALRGRQAASHNQPAGESAAATLCVLTPLRVARDRVLMSLCAHVLA
jgi:hypothetical protein